MVHQNPFIFELCKVFKRVFRFWEIWEPATIFIASSDLLCCLCQNCKKYYLRILALFCNILCLFFFVEFWNGSRLSFVFREYFAILFGKNLVILPTTVKFCWSKTYFQTFSGIFFTKLPNFVVCLGSYILWAVFCNTF